MGLSDKTVTRRGFVACSSAGLAAGAAGLLNSPAVFAQEAAMERKGRIKQSVCKWCYGNQPLETFAAYCASIGIQSIELAEPQEWPVLQKHGLICAMTPSHSIGKGLNRKENHAECLAQIRTSIEKTSEAGFPNIICFSGNRAGMDDEEGLDNCAIALKEIVGFAEQKKVTICMELLNSKRNHRDYMCDRTHWGGALVRRVGSPNFRLLYDIYHMQVQEGDVIATIREYKDCIGHYHTAGVPGRNELDEGQELYYPAIMKAIVETGFTGYVGQEFVPKKDPLKSLAEAVQLCDI
ncbi:MAG: TIM barrel protein [Phycisphaerae bacterium]|nr:TIM barrel protein [Phycisphaerae bacterium]